MSTAIYACKRLRHYQKNAISIEYLNKEQKGKIEDVTIERFLDTGPSRDKKQTYLGFRLHQLARDSSRLTVYTADVYSRTNL